MPPRCSVIIRCYNESAHLEKLLDGIAGQTLQDLEVLAVDSGSTDDTPRILERRGVRALCIDPREFSFGRSCNIGCEAAKGELMVFVSAHAYPVYENWLEELLRPMQDPRVAVSYGKQRGDERNAFSERRIFKAWYPDVPANADEQQHPFCNNANCAVRRTDWERLRYDETLTGLEDMEFAKRAQAEGRRVVYAPLAEIVHVHQETAAMIRNRHRREAMAYRRILPHERISSAGFLRLFLQNVLGDCLQAWQEGGLRRHLPGILGYRFQQFLGAGQGMRRSGPVTSELRRRFFYPPSPAGRTSIPANACPIDYAEALHG